MLGAYKKHPQAYFLYVEDCFLLSDNADAPYIFKSKVLTLFVILDIVVHHCYKCGGGGIGRHVSLRC